MKVLFEGSRAAEKCLWVYGTREPVNAAVMELLDLSSLVTSHWARMQYDWKNGKGRDVAIVTRSFPEPKCR